MTETGISGESPQPAENISALIEKIAKWMVDAPDEVYVDLLEDDVIEL